MKKKGVIGLLACSMLLVLPFVSVESAEEAVSDDIGMTLYAKKCAMCHGKDGTAKAMAKGSANLNDPAWQEANPVEAIVKVTTEGKGKMPKYESKLTAEEIQAVASHVKTLK